MEEEDLSLGITSFSYNPARPLQNHTLEQIEEIEIQTLKAEGEWLIATELHRVCIVLIGKLKRAKQILNCQSEQINFKSAFVVLQGSNPPQKVNRVRGYMNLKGLRIAEGVGAITFTFTKRISLSNKKQ
jgi:hypothetical protein